MSSEASNERSLIPLFVTSMVVVAPLLFILGLVVGNHLQGNSSLTADSISSWISAIATVAIAILTFILAKETWYLREAQIKQLEDVRRENIRPNVGVQLEGSHVGMNFVNVKVHNLGKGIARNISFRFYDRVGNEIKEERDPIVDKFKKVALFNQGLQSMGIGQEISSYLFSFIDLGGEVEGAIFKQYLHMAIYFEDVEGTPYSNAFVIDFAQFEGISELGGNDLHNIANEIKKVREQIGRGIKLSRDRIGVDIFSSKDRQAEIEARHAQAVELNNRQNV